MQVCVATTQVQPVPESAVIVRPGGGVSVTVTWPLDGELPTFVTLTVNVIGLPRDDGAPALRLRNREVGFLMPER